MGSFCSCCGEDTTENGLPLLSSQVTKIADLPLNRRRKHIIKALYAVLAVGLSEMTSLFSTAATDGSNSSDVSENEAALLDELISALDRTLINLDPELRKKERLELINRSTPLEQEAIRHRLLEWGTGYAGSDEAPTHGSNSNSNHKQRSSSSAAKSDNEHTILRARSQSMAPRGGKEMLSHSRYHLPRILELWFQADRDCSGSLEPAEVKDLLHQINIDVPFSKISQMIKEVDVSNNGAVEFGEFVVFYNKLTTMEVIKQLSTRLGMSVTEPLPSNAGGSKKPLSAGGSDGTPAPKKGGSTPKSRSSSSSPKKAAAEMTAAPRSELIIIPDEALQIFFLNEQKEAPADLRLLQSQVGKLRNYGGGSAATPAVFGVTAREFQLFLLDAACNSWIHPRESEVHMDMTQPYTHYFIDSSHNTYLAGHQLQGQSSCEMYKKALLNGCRCVELDCWDGPNNDPIVTHGFTLTTRLRFYDVIQTIKEFGFRTSAYPIMLSVELHTCNAQQIAMVQMMRDAFGDALLSAADAEASRLNGTEFSAEGLKYKVLVKGKRSGAVVGGAASGGGSLLTQDEEVLLEQQEKAEKEEAVAAAGDAAGGATTAGKDATTDGRKKKKSDAAVTPPSTPATAKGAPSPPPPAAAAKGHHQAVSAELNAITYIAAMPFVDVEKQLTKPHYGVSSVDENKIERWAKEGPQRYIDLTKQFLVRVYPKGLRTDSSNFNPQASWNCGAQLVALNIQTNDEGHRLNRYKFRVNGQCGMVLKPLCMRRPGVTVAASLEEWKVTVRVLCGVQLPKPGRSQRGEIIDPFVELFVSGYGADDTSGSRKKTRVIDNNGFNPHWDETFTFTVRFPEMAMLCVQVHEQDPITSELIADNAVPLTALREGYRCVPLYMNGTQLPSPACLLCHFSIRGKKATANDGALGSGTADAVASSSLSHMVAPPVLPLAAGVVRGSDDPAAPLSAATTADIVLDAFTEARLDML